VIWSPPGGAAVTAITGTDGTFVLRATGNQPARLGVQAPLHKQYAELVEPGAPFADYDVWPATTEMRLERGLTAVFSGVAVDEQGNPVTGAAVRWHPVRRAPPPGEPGRRVLEGSVLDLPLATTTRGDGSFELETEHFGSGRLTVEPGGGQGEIALDAEAVAGRTVTGLRLQR
jgi:hypothetical protein